MFMRRPPAEKGLVAKVAFIAIAAAMAVVGSNSTTFSPTHARAGGTLDGSASACGNFEVTILGLIGFDVPEPGWVYVNPAQKFQSVEGVATNSHVTHTDFPTIHDSHDQNTDIEVDPAYIGLVSTANSDSELEMEWEIGTFPSETGSDPERTFPKWAWPNIGDRVWVNGAHIFDCGHPTEIDGADHYRSEIHPPRAIASMRQQVATLPGTGTTPVPVTATDLFIHGHAGLVIDDLECGQNMILGAGSCAPLAYPRRGFPIDEDFEFDIMAPPKPVPSAVLATSVEDGPDNSLAQAPILTPNPDGVSVHVTIPLAGSGATPADKYARKIYVGWVYPSDDLKHLKLTLNLMDLHEDHDTDPGDCECTFFWMNVDKAPNEWIRLSTYATGNMNDYDDDNGLGDGEMGFSGAVFDFFVTEGQPFTVRANGYDQDCLDDLFGNPNLLLTVAGIIDCYVGTGAFSLEPGDNDAAANLQATFTAPGYGVGSQDVGSAGGEYELEFTIEDIALDVEDSADLNVTKLCQPTLTQLAGQQVQCTVLVQNPGPGLPRDVVLTDTLLTDVSPARYNVDSASFIFAGAGGSPNACDPLVPIPGGKQIICNLGTVPVGGTAIMTLRYTSQDGGNFDNVAVVSTTSTDPNLANNQDEDEVTVIPVADLEVTKTAAGGITSVVAGTSFAYELSVSNHGPSSAVNVSVDDVVPTGMTIISVSAPGGTCNAGQPGNAALPTTCNFTTIAPGDSRSMTIQVGVLPDALGVLANDAEVSSATLDTNAFNNLDTYPMLVVGEADLSIAKTSSAETYKPNEVVSFVVAVTNNGPSTARNVVVVDSLPASLQVTYISDTGGCVLAAAKVLQCGLGDLAPGETTAFFVYVKVKGTMDITNTASVSSTTSDPALANNTASKTVTIEGGGKPTSLPHS